VLDTPKKNLIFIFSLSFGLILHVSWYTNGLIYFLSNQIMLGHDFLSFYTASKIARTIGTHKIYDIQIQSSVQGSIAGENFLELNILPFIHPPYLIPLNIMIFHSQYSYTFLLWQVVSLVLFLAVFYILFRLLIINYFRSRLVQAAIQVRNYVINDFDQLIAPDDLPYTFYHL
jgi:hypothetical protein